MLAELAMTQSSSYHVPVMADEVVRLLNVRPGSVVVDGTVGGGGHAERILAAGARLIAIDRDAEAIAAARARLGETNVTWVHASFDGVEEALSKAGVDSIDGALLDLGVSSHQLDEDSRGFSFMGNGPLDMRMNRDGDRPASDLLNTLSHGEIAKILHEYGEERNAGKIASSILRRRESAPLETTRDLVEAVMAAFGGREKIGRIHVATRTFQALRIAVNDELGMVQRALPRFFSKLKLGGRLVVISFHSLEDRIVKHYFRELATGCICPPAIPVCRCGRTPRGELVTRKGLKASDLEIGSNPRARSAVTRAVEKISNQELT